MSTKYGTNIHDRVRLVRDSQKLTLKAMSETTGVAKRTIDNYEREISAPSFEYLSILRSKFGADGNWLLTGEGEMFTSQSAQQPLEQTPSARPEEDLMRAGQQNQPLAAGEPILRESASPYLSEADELEILQAVVSGVEKYCIVYDVTMPPEKKGLRIATIFERCRREYTENIKELTEQGKLIELKKAPIESEAKDLCELVNKLA